MVEQKQNSSSDESSQPEVSLIGGYDEMRALAGGAELPFWVNITRAALIAGKKVDTPQEASRLAVLEYAVKDGDVELLRKFLKEGIDPDTELFGRTLLDFAAEPRPMPPKPNVELVRELLKAGADPNKLSEGCSPLTNAVMYGSTDITKMLLEAGAELNAKGPDKMTVLTVASQSGCVDVLDLLLAKGVDVNGTVIWHLGEKPIRQVTALMFAAINGHDKIVKRLLDAGADPKMLDSDGNNAVDYAGWYAALAEEASQKKVAAKKVAEIIKSLKAAGAPKSRLSRPSFLPPPAPDFRKAARTENFRKAIKEMTKITGVKPKSLESIPGCKAYALPGVFLDEKPKALAAELHEKMLSLGCYVCYSYDVESEVLGNCILAVPTTDVYEVITSIGTHGGDSNCDTNKIIAWLRKLEKKQPFVLTVIGSDFLEGKFTTKIDDTMKLAKQIYKFCPDIVSQGIGTVGKLAKQLSKSPKIFFWWD